MSQTEWNVARVVISAPHGHSGKTASSIGLVGALRQAGHIVQPFKKGPDFIDPSWLGHVAGRPCRNLDCYWMNEDQINTSLVNGAAGADWVLIEGAMGLFDGVDLAGTGSTAQIARITQSPVILVVDATRMTRSIAPLLLGFMNFEKDITIAGVIFNKVARSRHENMLRSAVEKYCGIPVLGAIPKNTCSLFPERHLGLVPAAEFESVEEAVAGNIAIAERYLDLQGISAVAKTALPLRIDGLVAPPAARPAVKIGIMLDQSFTFYYPENLEALERAGAELMYIDSMKDSTLPPVDGLYIGGGFPEVFGAAIAANGELRAAIKAVAANGMPIYAECGGLMYLGRTVFWQGNEFAMCGVLPLDVVVESNPQGHGYTIMRSMAGNPFFAEGVCVKGHEFHHSRVINVGKGTEYAYEVLRGHGIDGKYDGIVYRNTFAAYNHIHAVANPEWAPRFISLAKSFSQEKTLLE